ncbi:MAG: hypothetical protein F6K30_16755 [Cyanothece sp. SIO2G6]|nr:hypothetical protein [Cyanothece sp. SIO2G6]
MALRLRYPLDDGSVSTTAIALLHGLREFDEVKQPSPPPPSPILGEGRKA